MRAKALSTPRTPFDSKGSPAHELHHARVRHRVHQLEGRVAQHAQAGDDHDDADNEAAVVIGGAKTLEVIDREPDGRQRRGADRMSTASFQASASNDVLLIRRPMRNLIVDMTPRTTIAHTSATTATDPRRRVHRADGLQRIPADAGAAGAQDHADDERGQRLHAAVSVGMIGIGGPRGDEHADEDDSRCENVAGKLEPGRKNRRRLRDDARDEVDGREKGAGNDARKGDALARPRRDLRQVAARPAALASALLEDMFWRRELAKIKEMGH